MITRPSQFVPLDPKKAGCDTQCKACMISAVNVTVNVNSGEGSARFWGLAVVVTGVPGPFSEPSDSGSLVRTRLTNQPVAPFLTAFDA